MTKVFVHVGEPKCGTTYLQNILWGNRAELATQGIMLAGSSTHDHFRAAQDLREAGQLPGDPARPWAGEWDALAKQARRLDGTVVISHELMAGATEQHAARAIASLKPADVHVVLTVRDMATLLPAEWQETVKHRNRRSWDGWLGDVIDASGDAGPRPRWFWRAHDTLDVARRWSAGLSSDKVHIVTLPRGDAPPQLLWQRFAEVIGAAPTVARVPRAPRNTSLGVAETQLLVRINRALPREMPDSFYMQAVRQGIARRVLARRPRGSRLLLPPERFDWATEWSTAVVDGIAREGYQVTGDLSELVPAADTGVGVRPSDVSDAEMLEAALQCVAVLLKDSYAAHDRSRVARTSHALYRLSNRHPALARLRGAARSRVDRLRTSGVAG